MENSKLSNSIGMAFGARKIIYGEKLLDAIKKQKQLFVIIGKNMGTTSKKKLIDKCNFYNIEYIEILTVEEIAKSCGKKTLVAVGINDSNFIKLIKSTL